MNVRDVNNRTFSLDEDDLREVLDGHVPDYPRQYAQMSLAVQAVALHYRSVDGGPYKINEVVIRGPRRLVKGNTGQDSFVESIHNHTPNWPDWVKVLVAHFQPE